MRPRLLACSTRSARALALAGAGALSWGVAGCGAPGNEAALVSSVAPRATMLGAGDAEPRGRTAETSKEELDEALRGRCPTSMVEIRASVPAAARGATGFCIDRYEGSLVEVLPSGQERAHSPFSPVSDLRRTRAVSAPNVYPQGYVSAVEAQAACVASGKRLCQVAEWSKACRGPDARSFGYGDRRQPGRCNDDGTNPVLRLYGRGRWTWTTMNQPALNQQDRTLARTGEHEGCTNGYGVYDMVGNLHEWVADPRGTFYGGYYQDVASVGHGAGCGYLTTAHEARYHDYSTGFRCCADLAGASPSQPRAAAPSRRRSKRR